MKKQVELVVSLLGATSEARDGLSLAVDRSISIALPLENRADVVARIARDCEIILERIQQDPKAVEGLVSAVTAGDLVRAKEIGKGVKLTEPDFEREGGGAFWLVIIVGALLLYSSEAR
jgi:hypothetical protein